MLLCLSYRQKSYRHCKTHRQSISGIFPRDRLQAGTGILNSDWRCAKTEIVYIMLFFIWCSTLVSTCFFYLLCSSCSTFYNALNTFVLLYSYRQKRYRYCKQQRTSISVICFVCVFLCMCIVTDTCIVHSVRPSCHNAEENNVCADDCLGLPSFTSSKEVGGAAWCTNPVCL